MRTHCLLALLLLSGCASRQSAAEPPPQQFEVALRPTRLGPEQQALYGIRSRVPLSGQGAWQRGEISVRGASFPLRRRASSRGVEIAVDADRDGQFGPGEVALGETVDHLLPLDGAEVLVRFHNSKQGSEYQVCEFWRAQLGAGAGRLELAVLRFGDAGICFCDSDHDGKFETVLPPKSPVWLEGRAFDLKFDFARRRLHATASARLPVAVGFKAPEAEAQALEGGATRPLWRPGETSVLLFCLPGCMGCQQLGESLKRIQDQAKGSGSRPLRFCVVGPDAAATRRMRDEICPRFEGLVSTEAWRAFAVRPTPTLFVVGPDGRIVLRQTGAGPGFVAGVGRAIATAQRQGRD